MFLFMSEHIAIDFETYYSSKTHYTLKTTIADHYCRHSLFEPYLVAVSDGKDCWAGSPKNFNWSALEGKILISHNQYFDGTVYDEMVHRGWAPAMTFKSWHCSANLSAYLCNRRSLDQAVEFLFKVKLDKTARSDANNKHWPQDFNQQERDIMLEYARKDAYWCWLLWEKFSDKWPEKEKQISQITINQGRRGVYIDKELLMNYLMWSHEMLQNTEKLIPWIQDAADESWSDFDDPGPTSIKATAEQCRRSGIPCPPVKSREGEEAYEEWETQYAPQNPWIPALSSWRSVNKLYKSFLTVKDRLRDDGTLPFGLKYFGAHTGRWAGEAKLNFQNMRRKPIYCNERGLMETDDLRKADPSWVRYSIDFRNLILPRPGKKMIVADLSQIEPRCLAWIVKDKNFLEQVSKGMSPYESHARATMGWTGGILKDENPDLYTLAKIRVLQLGYQSGWSKLIKSCLKDGIDITRDDPEFITNPITGKQESGYGQFAKKIVNDYRTQNPKIKGLWESLEGVFKRVGDDFEMGLPSGRSLRYGQVKCARKIETDPETKQPRSKVTWTADIGGIRRECYGGKLCENLIQAMARDVFVECMLRTESQGYPSLFSCHDELVFEVAKDVTPGDLEKLMSITPDWCPGLPVSAKAEEVPCYCKL